MSEELPISKYVAKETSPASVELPPLKVRKKAGRPRKYKLITPPYSAGAVVKDIWWVYQNIGKPESTVTEKEATEDGVSSGAWALLQWARTNKKAFFEKHMTDLIPSKFMETESDDKVDRRAYALTGLDELVRSLWGGRVASVQGRAEDVQGKPPVAAIPVGTGEQGAAVS